MTSGPSAWDKVRAWFRQEQRDVAEAVDEGVAHGNEVLDRKEREAAASPEERLQIEQERASAADAEYEALRKRIEGS